MNILYTYLSVKHDMNYSQLFQNFHIHSAARVLSQNKHTDQWTSNNISYMVKHHSYILHVCTLYVVILNLSYSIAWKGEINERDYEPVHRDIQKSAIGASG